MNLSTFVLIIQVNQQRMKHKKKTKTSGLLLWITGVLLLLIIAAGVYAYSVIFRSIDIGETIYI